jgi:hypothetical protein
MRELSWFYRTWFIIAALGCAVTTAHADTWPPVHKEMTESEVRRLWGEPREVINENGQQTWLYMKGVVKAVFAFWSPAKSATIVFNAKGRVTSYSFDE